MAWTYAFSKPCEPESFHESYSSGASPDKISTLQLLRRREVNERLCIKEVGVDLELCVHAHGPDVELIMEASCKIFNHLGNCFGVIKLDPLQLWFRPYYSSLIPFLGQCEYLSSVDQYTSPTFTLIFRRVLHPGISRLSRNCITSYEFSIKYHILTDSNFFTGSKSLNTQGHR